MPKAKPKKLGNIPQWITAATGERQSKGQQEEEGAKSKLKFVWHKKLVGCAALQRASRLARGCGGVVYGTINRAGQAAS